MNLKKIVTFYVTTFFIWGILLLIFEFFSDVETFSLFKDSLWQELLFIPVFLIVFGIPFVKMRKDVKKELELVKDDEKEKTNLKIKTIGTVAIFYAEAIIFMISIFVIMGEQAGIEHIHQAYENWKGFIIIIGYVYLPFNLAWLHHGKEISNWIQTSPHRPNINNY